MLEQIAARAKPFPPSRFTPTTKSTELARSITRGGSVQTYLVARLLVDRGMGDDCCRAYAYFRWADDVIDVTADSPEERVTFIRRQLALIRGFYNGEQFDDLSPEEEMLADLIHRDRSETSGLHSFISNFITLLEFDAHRKGRLISQDELDWYSEILAKAVTDGIQHFIGHGYPYPTAKGQYKAVVAAHITHMLRDMAEDLAEGYINIPHEYLEAHDLDPEQLDSEPMRHWVRERVRLAQRYLEEGKRYMGQLEVLRCGLAGIWYCTLYEWVLRTIERDGFVLRKAYRYKLSTIFNMMWVGFSATIDYLFRRLFSFRR